VAGRARHLARRGHPALFLNRRGGRLSTRAVVQLVDELAQDADLVNEAGKPPISAQAN
jgi:site-specific recombinase XerD